MKKWPVIYFVFMACIATAAAVPNVSNPWGVLQTFLAGIATNQIYSVGGHPTLTSGSCSGSAAAGGLMAGSFTAAVCAGGTFILSALPAAPTGYTCDAQDQTTPSDALKQTANTTTSVTLTSTTVASDAIVFKCIGW